MPWAEKRIRFLILTKEDEKKIIYKSKSLRFCTKLLDAFIILPQMRSQAHIKKFTRTIFSCRFADGIAYAGKSARKTNDISYLYKEKINLQCAEKSVSLNQRTSCFEFIFCYLLTSIPLFNLFYFVVMDGNKISHNKMMIIFHICGNEWNAHSTHWIAVCFGCLGYKAATTAAKPSQFWCMNILWFFPLRSIGLFSMLIWQAKKVKLTHFFCRRALGYQVIRTQNMANWKIDRTPSNGIDSTAFFQLRSQPNISIIIMRKTFDSSYIFFSAVEHWFIWRKSKYAFGNKISHILIEDYQTRNWFFFARFDWVLFYLKNHTLWISVCLFFLLFH